MRYSAVFFLIALCAAAIFAQPSKTSRKKTPASGKTTAAAAPVDPANEKQEFDKAAALTNETERIAALQAFIEKYPQSTDKIRAQELIVGARAAIADEKLRFSETAGGVEFFKTAVRDAPQPMSDKIFSEIILQFPTNLFWRGQRDAAFEIAKMIEAKTEGNPKQTLALATFYLGIENAAEAQRIAEKALAADPNLPAAYQTLGLAHRINFELDDAVAAYAKAVELDPRSVVSRRSLAEMKRAVGKPDEAAALYREILTADAGDGNAQTGLILSLFDAERRDEAEAEMTKALAASPNNLTLLVGAAYWYAAHNEAAKAVEAAEKAVAVEPRYTWAHIALARGLMNQNRPLEAERTLVAARQYGSFPTLDYELAAARMKAGFFREAAELLGQNFAVGGDGAVETKLGGRIPKTGTNFIALLALERRAGIFEPLAADDLENAEKLKSLLDYYQKLKSKSADDGQLSQAADVFIGGGDDKMSFHRRLFVADSLLKNQKNLPKVMDLIQASVGKSDAALDVPNASAVVLADELYESRALAAASDQLIVVPEVSRQTLAAILRGRIEQIAGWTLYGQNKPGEASVRLKRAVSVLPEKSSWWRASMWQLGMSLDAAGGKEKEALAAYLKAYLPEQPDGFKYAVIESLYKRVNGSADGLEAKIGTRPVSAFAAGTTVAAAETPAPAAAQTANPAAPETAAPIAETAAPTVVNSEPAAVETRPAVTPAETKSESVESVTAAPIINETAAAPPKIEEPAKTEEPVKTEEATKTEEPTKLKTDVTTSAEVAAPSVPETSAATSPAPEPKSVSPTENPPVNLPAAPVSAPVNAPIEKSATAETAAPAKPKSLFEPVIITIPSSVAPKKSSVSAAENDEKPAQTAELETAVPNPETAGATRPRYVAQNAAPCVIVSGQENVSLLSGGGSIGILVGFEDNRKTDVIKAVSASPRDVEVTLEPDIGALSGRSFFIIKSISQNPGEFTVAFEAACGRKEIVVRVR